MKHLATVLCVMLAAVPCAATEAIPWQDADGHVGEQCTVEGKVVSARREGNVLRFAFDADPAAFSVALIGGLLSPLPGEPAALYEGRTIRATGKIRSFRGISEMVIRDPTQISVVPLQAEPSPTPVGGLEQRLEQLERRVERLEQRLKK